MLSKSHVWSVCPNLLVLDRDLVRAVAVSHLCGVAVWAVRPPVSRLSLVGCRGWFVVHPVPRWSRVDRDNEGD